jgi:hypothetical protein
MIQFGNDKIKDIYHGSDKIKEVYHGSELVYTAYDSRGYWVHKDTGVKTYFGLDADFITNGIMSEPSWKLDCSEVNIPEGVTSLGAYCFYYCTSLTSITLPEGVTSLGAYCFYWCTSLTSITLPESVTSLGAGCFYECSSLPSITLPESVTSVGNYCFDWCTSLILATVLPAIPPSLGSGVFNNVHTSFNIKVRSPYVNAYKTATNWTAYADKISAI